MNERNENPTRGLNFYTLLIISQDQKLKHKNLCKSNASQDSNKPSKIKGLRVLFWRSGRRGRRLESCRIEF